MAGYDITAVSLKERPDLTEGVRQLCNVSWPEFAFQNAIAAPLWSGLYRIFADYQFALLDEGKLVGEGNSVPVAWNGDVRDLPDEGWEWAIAKGFEDHAAGRNPQTLCALQIIVAEDQRGKGLSMKAIETMKAIGKAHGLKQLIAPVRPNMKTVYPLAAMEHYVRWKGDDGLPFDPWLRAHVRTGGEIVKVCKHSYHIRGTVAQWEGWTKMRFPESGPYVLPVTLNPIVVDLENDQIVYTEPNVWVRHLVP